MLFEKKIEAIFRQNVCVRWNDTGKIYYFQPEDFPGLRQVEHSFRGEWGQRLKGYFYYIGTPTADRVIILDHGMTCGHRLYMTEIATLAKKGFLVYSYDHTGCVESEGENANGMVQSLGDLRCCINDLKKVPSLKNTKFAVIGHSWGGFSALNISKYHPDVTHVISLAGYLSMERMLRHKFSGLLRPYRDIARRLELEWNPEYAKVDGIENLKNFKGYALLIHSKDDDTISKKHHFDAAKKALNDRDNVFFYEVNHRRHNPNYTEEAVKYKSWGIRQREKAFRKGELKTPQEIADFHANYDWHKMTEQDPKVWAEIFRLLER